MLGLSAQRVRALLAEGELPGQKVAGRWFVDRSALQRRLRNPKLSGRPYSPAHAWALIALAEGENPKWLDASNRSRLRRLLREQDLQEILPSLARRGRRLQLRAHASDLPRIEAEPDVVRSGVSAASEHRLEILAPGVLEAYVPARRLPQLERRFRLKPSADANVILHVVDGPWPFSPEQRLAPRLAAVLDLFDHDDERTRRAAQRALRSYKPAEA
ncbi:MAG: helix-turn-helix domain-containing protein [Chloroflexi bacterium]|nr:helix-turn-helix domain-containing protein [Chloroflexota bacterium]